MKLHRESIDRLFDYDLHLETRTIFITDREDEDGGVGPGMADRLIKSLHILTAQDSQKPIQIILNSQGGSWYDGMAIYDAIRMCPCPVTIEVFGSCMSMATVILQAGDERVIHPNATFLVHDGTDYFEGEAKNFEAWGRNSKKIRNRMYEIYAESSGRDIGFWQKKCSSDFIIGADEVVALGLADRIAGADENNEEQED